MTQISAYGLSVNLPTGWNGLIFKEYDPPYTTTPALHAATFPLPTNDADSDFGNYAVDIVQTSDSFFALVEFFPDVLAQRDQINVSPAVFAAPMLAPQNTIYQTAGLPGPYTSPDFSADTILGRTNAAQPGGVQSFFRASGRSFCLYVVTGSQFSASQISVVNSVIASIQVAPAVQIYADTLVSLDFLAKTFSGSGSGACAFSAVNGDFNQTVPCTLTLSGTITTAASCSADWVLSGNGTFTLNDGRHLSCSLTITIPGLQSQSTVAEFAYDGNDASIPAACILNGGTCTAATSARLNLTGVFDQSRVVT